MSSVEPKKLSAKERTEERRLKREADRIKEKDNNELLRKREHILSRSELQSFFSREDVKNVFNELNLPTDGDVHNLLIIKEWFEWCQQRVEDKLRKQEFGMLVYDWSEIKEMISYEIDNVSFEEICDIEFNDDDIKNRIIHLALLHKKEYRSGKGLTVRDIEIWCERYGISL